MRICTRGWSESRLVPSREDCPLALAMLQCVPVKTLFSVIEKSSDCAFPWLKKKSLSNTKRLNDLRFSLDVGSLNKTKQAVWSGLVQGKEEDK